MRPTGLLPFVLAFVALPACATATPDRTAFAPGAPVAAQPVSVDVRRPDGGAFPSYFHRGSTYVAGDFGARYTLELTNHTAARVEAVVSVDGRDVVSGELGNFRRQRGYVIEPFGSVTVDGFRQSLDQVAAFRFSELGESYSARRGTPAHVGVIGVAVFREKPRRDAGAYAVAPIGQAGPRAFPEAQGRSAGARERVTQRPARRDNRAPPSAEAEPPAAAAAPFESEDVGASRAGAATGSAAADRSFAPPPTPRNELGTQYGESTWSAVARVEFKRHRARRPDAMLTLYYDSPRGLAARGVPVAGTFASGGPVAFPANR